MIRALLGIVRLCVCASVPALSVPASASAQASIAQLLSGQELIYRGRFGAAQVFFSDLSREFPRDPAGPALEASALIWWGEARGDEKYQAAQVDSLLVDATNRADLMLDSAKADGERRDALYWLGVIYGYRARQAEVRGSLWRAARDARTMNSSFEAALAIDSTCIDCLSGPGVYDYELARAGALARVVARLIGLGGGNAQQGLARMRRAAEEGTLTRIEARWVYANALLREGERDAAQREQGLRMLADLAAQFPENPVFRRTVPHTPGGP